MKFTLASKIMGDFYSQWFTLLHFFWILFSKQNFVMPTYIDTFKIFLWLGEVDIIFLKKETKSTLSFCIQAVHQCSLISPPNILKRRVRGFNWACCSFKLSGLFLTLPGELTITSSEFLWGPHGIGHGSWQQVPGQFLPLLLLVERMSHCEPLLQRDKTWISVTVGPIKLLRMRSADSSIFPGPSWEDILTSSCSCRGRGW